MFKLLASVATLALLLSANAMGRDIEVICPCEVTAVSDTALRASFSLARHFSSEEIEEIDVRVGGQANRFDSSYYFDAYPRAVSIFPAVSEVQSYSILLPIARSSSEQTYSRLLFGNGTYKSIILKVPVPRTSNYGYASKDSSLIMMENATMELGSDSLTVTVPPLLNFGVTDLEAPVLRLYLLDPDDGSGYVVSEKTLDTAITAGTTTSADIWTVNFDGSRYLARTTRLALAIGEYDEQGEFDQHVIDFALDRFDESAELSLNYSSENVPFFDDEDGDGLSDYNEQVLSSRLNEDDIAIQTVRLSFVTSEEAALKSDDINAEIEHVVAHTNNIYEASGVNARFQLADIITGGSEDQREASCDVPFDCLFEDLLSDLRDAKRTYVGAAALEADGSTDIIVGLADAEPSSFDTAFTCGLAPVTTSILNEMPRAINANGRRETIVGLPSAACGSDTLAHEIGHIGGLGHSKKQGSLGKTGYARGYGIDNTLATVMAYEQEFNTTGVELFSSPSLVCRGFACGVDRTNIFNGADGSFVLNQTMPYVAAYAGGFLPAISLSGDLSMNIEFGAEYEEPGFTAFDPEDGDISSTVALTFSNSEGDTVSTIDTSVAGATYLIEYSVSDSDLNESVRVRQITVASGDEDRDTDGDGVNDEDDAFPNDPTESVDTDGDGIGNNADTDDDNDGYTDEEEIASGTDPLDAASPPQPSAGLPIWLLYEASKTNQPSVSQGKSPIK